MTRAHGLARYSDQGRRSGYSIGRGGDVLLRVYDKPLEMQKSGKVHAQRRWLENGWDGNEVVWRVELQLRRNALRELGVSTPADLLSRAGALWHYGVERWCRLAIPSAGDETRTRWDTHPFWEAITASGDFACATPVPRRALRQSRAPSDDAIVDRFIGALTDYMATCGEFQTGRALAMGWTPPPSNGIDVPKWKCHRPLNEDGSVRHEYYNCWY